MPTLFAPAKVNLGLRVLGRRDDGYHLLESLFVPLDLGDDVVLDVERVTSARVAGVEFTLTWEPGSSASDEVPADQDNLAVRAARAFLDAAGLRGRVDIRLHKRIPAGAGLGGGSSDAGAVLRGLRARHPDALSADALARVALGLGADVPFFLDPRPSVVTGIGEVISPLQGFPRLWLLLVNPGNSLATPQVFRAFDSLAGSLTAIEPGSTMRALFGLGESPEALGEALDSGLLVNDLEPAARRLCPPVGRTLERLRALGARWVGMSGSGATVYGIFPTEESARGALLGGDFGPPGWAAVASTSLSEGVESEGLDR